MIVDTVDGARGEWEQDGFRLVVSGQDASYTLRVVDVESAREVVAAADQLRDWVAEHDRERVAYDLATPAERAAVIHGETDVEWDRDA